MTRDRPRDPGRRRTPGDTSTRSSGPTHLTTGNGHGGVCQGEHGPVEADPPLASGERWIIAANRGPVQFTTSADGRRIAGRGSGGLVTALRGLMPFLEDSVVICAARSEEDRAVASEFPAGIAVGDETIGGRSRQTVRFLDLPQERFEQYYSVISNPLIWFVQHNLWDVSNAPNLTESDRFAFDQGYRAVNQMFADAIVSCINEEQPNYVMIHDYHLYLVGAMVRQARPGVVLSHFVHVPWPQPEAWRVLPRWFREQLFAGLVGNDMVTFQTQRDADNFVLTCAELMNLPVSMPDRVVRAGERTVSVRAHPISIDPEQLEAQAESEEVKSFEQALENVRREHLIVRVDRTDLSKNILRGFLAYDRMLDQHPDLAGRVTFLALLQPSRQDVVEYAEYTERILRLVADINLKQGNVEWQPIDLRMEDNFAQSLAAYKVFDVLMVNPVHDGLNLVAKEGMLLNRREGVLVLSEHAGVHAELGSFALSVHPIDIEEQAAALFDGLFMPQHERSTRKEGCVRVIRENGLDRWISVLVDELHAVGQALIDAGFAPSHGS